jgi:hypothetical protein
VVLQTAAAPDTAAGCAAPRGPALTTVAVHKASASTFQSFAQHAVAAQQGRAATIGLAALRPTRLRNVDVRRCSACQARCHTVLCKSSSASAVSTCARLDRQVRGLCKSDTASEDLLTSADARLLLSSTAFIALDILHECAVCQPCERCSRSRTAQAVLLRCAVARHLLRASSGASNIVKDPLNAQAPLRTNCAPGPHCHICHTSAEGLVQPNALIGACHHSKCCTTIAACQESFIEAITTTARQAAEGPSDGRCCPSR